MWKYVLVATLCLRLLMPIPVNVANEKATVSQPVLTFSGTTALCEFDITSIGKNISVTMELWNGNTLVDSWVKNGIHIVSISESCSVVSGQTYTLEVTGSIGENSFTSVSVSKRCP